PWSTAHATANRLIRLGFAPGDLFSSVFTSKTRGDTPPALHPGERPLALDQEPLLDRGADRAPRVIERRGVAEAPDQLRRQLVARTAAAADQARAHDVAVGVDRQARHEHLGLLALAMPPRVDQPRRARP